MTEEWNDNHFVGSRSAAILQTEQAGSFVYDSATYLYIFSWISATSSDSCLSDNKRFVNLSTVYFN